MSGKTLFLLFFVLFVTLNDTEAKRSMSRSRSSGSGRGTSRRTNSNPQPVPTSISHAQASAPKPSLFGWQEKPAQKSHGSSQSNHGHSYPSSNTGLSGNNQPKSSLPNQETIQRSNVPSQQSSYPSKNSQTGISYPASTGLSGNNQPKSSLPGQDNIQRSNVPLQQSSYSISNSQSGHSYPGSNGLSGNTGSVGGYPQGSGLSGSNAAPPPYQGINSYNNARSPTHPNNNFNNQYPHGAPPQYSAASGNNYNHHPQGPPPPYTNFGHHPGGYGGYSPQSPGYFGNYVGNGRTFGGVSRTGSALTGVGIAGAGIGTVLTGLALWNLARSTGHHHHTVIYDNRGQPVGVAPVNNTTPVEDPILGELVNCTLTISNDNNTEILAIPCSIATSFTPDADVKDVNMNNSKEDNTKCTVTVVTKTGKEFMTTIPCSVLLNSAAENNVTEAPIVDNTMNSENSTVIPSVNNQQSEPIALKFSGIDENLNNTDTSIGCVHEPGEIRDPINPCFSVKHNLTVIPLPATENQ